MLLKLRFGMSHRASALRCLLFGALFGMSGSAAAQTEPDISTDVFLRLCASDEWSFEETRRNLSADEDWMPLQEDDLLSLSVGVLGNEHFGWYTINGTSPLFLIIQRGGHITPDQRDKAEHGLPATSNPVDPDVTLPFPNTNADVIGGAECQILSYASAEITDQIKTQLISRFGGVSFRHAHAREISGEAARIQTDTWVNEDFNLNLSVRTFGNSSLRPNLALSSSRLILRSTWLGVE